MVRGFGLKPLLPPCVNVLESNCFLHHRQKLLHVNISSFAADALVCVQFQEESREEWRREEKRE